jgi:glucose/arabinose dehydrogenase
MSALPSPTSRVLALVATLATVLAAVILPTAPASAQAVVEEDIAYEVLADLTTEPLSIDIADDGRIFWAQRDGTVNVLTPSGQRSVAGILSTSGNLCVPCPQEGPYTAIGGIPTGVDGVAGVGGLEEGGLHGILLDDDFLETGKIFTYRSIPGSRTEVEPGLFEGEFHLSSFVVDLATNRIDPESEEVLLTVPAEWDHCCHYAGDLDYLPDGTITLTTGDDVPASSSGGYGPRDPSAPWLDAERTSANPADRRGKILRLTEDGEVPGIGNDLAPNPFIGMEGYIPQTLATDEAWVPFDPYIYSLGWKQPWRAVVHPSGTMYVSDVGPDAGVDDPERGPRGLEEINRVPLGGGTHMGWPRCVGPNLPYVDVDWTTMEVGEPLDCSADAVIARPIGSTDEAEWVRGMTGAVMYYPSGASEEWPIVGSGGKTSEPVAFYPGDADGPLRLPERYDDRLLVLEWSRNFILSIGSDPQTGELDLDNDDMWLVTPPPTTVSVNPDNVPGTVSAQQLGRYMAPADGVVGPDGAFYFVEYGLTYYAGMNGRLSRIRCADCAPADAAANYGLPVADLPGTPAVAAGVGGVGGVTGALPPAAEPAALVVAALGLAALIRRRLRHTI